MRISKLKIQGFRGLNLEEDFDILPTSTLILSGVNGSGKTTVIDVVDILLTKSRENIDTNHAAAVTDKSATLEVSLFVSDDDIDFIAENIAQGNPSLNLGETIKEVKQLFPKNSFTRRLTINKQSVNWTQKSEVRDEINGDDESQNITGNLLQQVLQNLCIRFSTLENISVGQIINLNTRFNIRSSVQGQDEAGQRRNKTNIDLTAVFSANLHQRISESVERDLEDSVLSTSEYYNPALEPYRIVLDKAEFDRSKVVLIQLEDSEGRKYSITQASAGQKQAIALLTLLKTWSESKGKPVLLMDEPDTGMHPEMIQKVTITLKEELKGNESTCIIATHSPEVVKSYSSNVFRLIRDTTGKVNLHQISNLQDRVELLNNLGVSFDLSYLIGRIIFVESVVTKTSGLSDESIYQKIVDPDKKKVLFKAGPHNLGGKADLDNRQKVFNQLIEALIGDTNFKAWTLSDRDDGVYRYSPPKLNTPYQNVEYFLIVNPAILSNVLKSTFNIELSELEITNFFISRDVKYRDKKLDVDAKSVWKAFLNKLRADNSFDAQHITSLETELVQELRNANFPKIDEEVKIFISELKK